MSVKWREKKQEPEMPSKQLWIEELRILATLAVILLHVAATKVKSAALLYEDCYIWLSVYDTVTRFAVNCFVMITGSLLLRPEKKLTISQLWKKYIPRILMLFAVWSAVYIVVDMFKSWVKGNGVSFQGVWTTFLYGHYHMWYLYMLIGLYMITPILREVVKNRKLIEYMLILSMIFYLFPNMLQLWTPEYTILKKVLNKLTLQFVGGYVAYYLMGYYLTGFELKKWQKYGIYLGGILGIVYGVIGGIYFSRAGGVRTQVPFNNTTLNIFLFSSAVFLFFKEHGGKRNTEKYKRFLLSVSSATLGVYLMHPALVKVTAARVMEKCSYHYLWLVLPVMSIGIFVVCAVLSLLLKKLPIVGKYIV